MEPIYNLTNGQTCTVGNFRVTKVRQGVYCAVDIRYTARSRWGTLQEILSDVQHGVIHGTLPRAASVV